MPHGSTSIFGGPSHVHIDPPSWDGTEPGTGKWSVQLTEDGSGVDSTDMILVADAAHGEDLASALANLDINGAYYRIWGTGFTLPWGPHTVPGVALGFLALRYTILESDGSLHERVVQVWERPPSAGSPSAPEYVLGWEGKLIRFEGGDHCFVWNPEGSGFEAWKVPDLNPEEGVDVFTPVWGSTTPEAAGPPLPKSPRGSRS